MVERDTGTDNNIRLGGHINVQKIKLAVILGEGHPLVRSTVFSF